MLLRKQINLAGRVQGVGFRPFVWQLANRRKLRGWVRNTAEGVRIDVEGPRNRVENFLTELKASAPKAAKVTRTTVFTVQTESPFKSFHVFSGKLAPAISNHFSPDLGTCEACLKEVFDPSSRRFRYPFTTCSHCGPRYTILKQFPYRRSQTTLSKFPLCKACLSEYFDPNNRRFHAETLTCAQCGPELSFTDKNGNRIARREEALAEALRQLKAGKILAVKSMGGFHFFVDARNTDAIHTLRKRKHRPSKPFAVLFRQLSDIEPHCHVSEEEKNQLQSKEGPIVLLEKKECFSLSESVSQNNHWLGAFLPSNPLHSLVMEGLDFPVVATSANLSGNPLVFENDTAFLELNNIVDGFLIHNRPIAHPIDDSVLRVVDGNITLLRLGRGFAPKLWDLREPTEPLLSLGATLKSTFSFSNSATLYLSPQFGNLNNPKVSDLFESELNHSLRLYGVQPTRITADNHPDGWLPVNTQTEVIRVPHHYAHALSCLFENRSRPPALAFAWDGFGLGPNGEFLGGETLLLAPKSISSVARLKGIPLLGGENAFRDPTLIAVGMLLEMGLPDTAVELFDLSKEKLTMLSSQMNSAPKISSIGRLFDGVSALLGFKNKMSFEAEAALYLESLASQCKITTPYSMAILESKSGLVCLDWEPLVKSLLHDLERLSAQEIALKFHAALAQSILKMSARFGQTQILLTGGCFQNKCLLESTLTFLRRAGYSPLTHREVPCNDTGISLGQWVYGQWQLTGVFPCA